MNKNRNNQNMGNHLKNNKVDSYWIKWKLLEISDIN